MNCYWYISTLGIAGLTFENCCCNVKKNLPKCSKNFARMFKKILPECSKKNCSNVKKNCVHVQKILALMFKIKFSLNVQKILP